MASESPQQPSRLFFYCAASPHVEILTPLSGLVAGANGLERVKNLRSFWANKCGDPPDAWGVYGECVPADELAELRRKAEAYDTLQRVVAGVAT